MLQVLPVLSKANRISSQYSRRRSKIPQDVFGLATTLVLFYGLDDLALIESTCFHYPKNQKLYLSLFQSSGGNTLWCAFWLEGVEFWPPEIDVFEAYTEDDEHDINPVPNIHFGTNSDRNSPDQSYKRSWFIPNLEYDFSLSNKRPMKLFAAPYRFVQFAVHWTSDFVRIYYDGILYREYCSPDLPPLYSNPDVTMRIVLNNGVMDSFSVESECGDDKPFETATMFIDNIRVYQMI